MLVCVAYSNAQLPISIIDENTFLETISIEFVMMKTCFMHNIDS